MQWNKDDIQTFEQEEMDSNCMEKIKSDNPELEEVLVFPAMPNSLAIRTGMDYMPKCDPKLIIYDQINHSSSFIEAIVIGG